MKGNPVLPCDANQNLGLIEYQHIHFQRVESRYPSSVELSPETGQGKKINLP